MLDEVKERDDTVDLHVGARVRTRRLMIPGMTQQRLAEEIGVTFRQVSHYERGTNAIAAGRLYEIACVLDVPVGYFFDGLPPSRGLRPAPVAKLAQTQAFVNSVMRIKNKVERRHVTQLTSTLARANRKSGSGE